MDKIKYRIGKRKREHSLPIDEVLERFGKTKEAENYTLFRYPFKVCFYRFISEEIKGINAFNDGQYDTLEHKFKSRKNENDILRG